MALVAVLALVLGLVLGLESHAKRGSHDTGFVWTYDRPLAVSEPWFPSPRGGSSPQWRASYAKAARAVVRMTLAEKVNITTGTGWQMGPCVGNTGAAASVGFPGLCLQDGPLGVRFADRVSVFPAGITVASSWDRLLMERRGRALASEMRAKGVNVALGPAMLGGRLPAAGRAWEGFGSDPYLAGVAVGRTVRGIQAQGVVACAKHWLANEQEQFRRPDEAKAQGWPVLDSISANIGGRPLREIYAWPFMDAVKEGVGAVMCAYNQFNNSYACQNSYLLNGLLKDELNFQGFVVSDWAAQRSGVASVLAGLDMTMPGDGLAFSDGKSFLGGELSRAVLNGSVPISRLDDMALRILAVWYQMGQDSPAYPKQPNFSSWYRSRAGPKYFGSDNQGREEQESRNSFRDAREDHATLAREIATESIVLLKNERRTLPFGSRSAGGGGRVRKAIVVFGSDAAGNPDGLNACNDRGCNNGTLGQGWGSGTAEYSSFDSPLDAITKWAANDSTAVEHVLSDTDYPRISAAAAKHADAACIVFASADSGEGYISAEGNRGDRKDLKLWHDGDKLILTVAANCRDTLVVVHAVGPVEMDGWALHPNVTAVLLAHLPGQEAGSSLAAVLWGDVNPSGKLAYTIARSLADYGAGAQVIVRPNHPAPQQDFDEGLYTDYRYFDKHGIAPRFEFGFGLSYTTFAFENMTIVTVTAAIPSEFPPPRPAEDAAVAPELRLNSTLPSPEAMLFPKNLRRVPNFIYPYLESISSTTNATGGEPPQPHARSAVAVEALFDTLIHVAVHVRNTGRVPGKAVAQLYLSFPRDPTTNQTSTSSSSNSTSTSTSTSTGTGNIVDFPVRVLRGFEKVGVGVGESVEVGFDLTRRDLSYWDEAAGNWRLPVDAAGVWGGYTLLVAGSSRDRTGAVEGVSPRVRIRGG